MDTQSPHFELNRFLCEHLIGQAHSRDGSLTLGRLLHKLFMKLSQVAHSEECGVGVFFKMYYMFCYIMQSDEIVMITIPFRRFGEGEIEGSLEAIVTFQSSLASSRSHAG